MKGAIIMRYGDNRPVKIMTIPEAVKQLEKDGITNLGAYRLRLLCAQNQIPHLKFGRKYIINYIALIEYLRNGIVDLHYI